MLKMPLPTDFILTRQEDSHIVETQRRPIAGASACSAFGADWEPGFRSGTPDCRFHASVTQGTARNVAAGLSWTDPEWSVENYVLIPGAVYNGNRFHSQPYDYSPPTVGPDL